MKTQNLVFGLFAIAMLASVGFAQPEDYSHFKVTGACIRNTVDNGGLFVGYYPQGGLMDYEQLSFQDFSARYYVIHETQSCPKVNGVAICTA